MAESISDEQVVAVLRPFVRATSPMLDALRQSDPLGLVRKVLPAARRDGAAALTGSEAEDAEQLRRVEPGLQDKLLHGLDSVKVPGTPAWQSMTIDQRSDWWINRVGRFTVLLASIPGIGGVIADRLPIQDALGAAGQGLVLSAIGGEYGLGNEDRVRLIAHVVFGREISPELATGGPDRTDADRAAEDEATRELTEDLHESERAHGRVTLSAAGRTLWRFGRTLWGISGELEKRPHGRWYHQVAGMLPVVGLFADYLGERSALKRAYRQAHKWIIAHELGHTR